MKFMYIFLIMFDFQYVTVILFVKIITKWWHMFSDPHIKVRGKQEDVVRAKLLVMQVLDTKWFQFDRPKIVEITGV